MIGLVRLAIFGLIGLTVVYLIVSIYSGSVRRERLEKQWDGDHRESAGDAGADARAAFVEAGMVRYRNGLRRKLIVLVYVVPILTVIGLVYILNFN